MFYTAGEQYSYDLIYTVARAHFDAGKVDLELGDFQRAYRAWREHVQPHIPQHDQPRPRFCNDAATEATLLRAIAVKSPLDDLPHYKEPKAFMQVASDRARIEADAAHAEQQYRSFQDRDPAFWKVFDLYVENVACIDSKFSPGGTISTALGVIYLSNPRKRSALALYELYVHECTHLMMFVDQARRRHYASFEAIADKANYCVSAIYEMDRPLDKVLHSLVVATELVLHREHVLGHHDDTSVHPSTAKLVESSRVTAEAMLEQQARRQLLAPRGVWLVERCHEHLEGLAQRRATPKVA
ncbi:MAG TPA: HEXXH motif-containing putative peptide modification protein [Labilithrix sp.]|nr:HEXXH motif-containing putative peptide modification protein [Labilithrix sp.]